MGKLRRPFPEQHSKTQTGAMSKVKKNPIKVTYISSPMKVKASNASEFRAIVQELTGKNSDANKEHSEDSYTTVNLQGQEANQVINNDDEAAEQLMKDIAAQEYFLDDAFSSQVSSSLELDERFLVWRSDVSAESSFGFQSPCLSLYH